MTPEIKIGIATEEYKPVILSELVQKSFDVNNKLPFIEVIEAHGLTDQDHIKSLENSVTSLLDEDYIRQSTGETLEITEKGRAKSKGWFSALLFNIKNSEK